MTAAGEILESRTSRGAAVERLGAAGVYAAGGVLYLLLREGGGIDFTASPFLYGLMLLAASCFRPRLLAAAVLMLIWGAAVILDGKGPFESGRTAPFFMIAFGLGAAALVFLRNRIDSRVALESIAVVMLTAGVWFYLIHDFPVLEKAWVWTAYFLLYAAGLVVAELWHRRRSTV